MIVRVLGEGQFELADDHLGDLNAHDEELVAAVERDDEAGFERALASLLEEVRARGRAMPEDYLGPSDLVLPASDASIEQVRELLSDEGLIPG